VEDLLQRGKVVMPVDVLVGMGWRLLRILRFHAHDMNLKPSWTAYMRRGRGPKQRLRFTKTGDPRLEEAYATHFVSQGRLQPSGSKKGAL
jgi:hypothetical protein